MRKLISILLLLCPLLAYSQGFTPRRPYVLTSASTVSTNPVDALPVGMEFWWNAKDLSNSPVSLWTDRIKGYNFFQTNASARPTWTTNGVAFDGVQQYFIATNSYVPDNNSFPFLAIFQFNATTANQMLLCQSYGGGTVILGMGTVANYFYDGAVNAGVGPIGTNIVDFSYSLSSATNYNACTNGVIAHGNMAWPNAILARVGSGDGNAFANVVLKELIVWTNSGYPTFTNYWSATTRSNVHWYATNEWGGSP